MFGDAGNNITYVLQEDQHIRGTIAGFESYLFVTSDKYIRMHRMHTGDGITYLDGRAYVSDGVSDMTVNPPAYQMEGSSGSFCMKRPALSARKDILSFFNRLCMEKGMGDLSSSRFACTMVEIKDKEKHYVREQYKWAADDVCETFMEWCRKEERIGVCVEHLEETDRLPHVHFLYERRGNERNRLQIHLMGLLRK